MSWILDKLTEGEHERILMERVRSGNMTEEELQQLLPRFPLKLQIQTMSPCNARCITCPWPSTAGRLPQGTMPDELFDLIVSQIAGRGVERVGMFLMNEPLLDRRLPQLTARLKQADPAIETVIYTNGTLLKPEVAVSLAEAGMTEINVSVIGFSKEEHERLMEGVKYETVLSYVTEIGELHRTGQLGDMIFRVVGLDFAEARAGIEDFQQRTGLDVFLKAVTNRAGSVDLVEAGVPGHAGSNFQACQRPFVKAYVLYNGDLVLCNCDWERSVIVGNLRERSIEEIWHGERLMEIRRHHLRAEIPKGSLCSGCDYCYIQ